MHTHSPTRISQTRRVWLPVLLALGLLAALWLALGWTQAGRAEVDSINIAFVFQDGSYDKSQSESKCGPEQENRMVFWVHASDGFPAEYPVVVNYNVQAGGNMLAVPDVDFASVVDGELTFDYPGQDVPINVQIVCDGIDEPDEEFELQLIDPNPNDTVVVSDIRPKGEIVDDDVPLATINDITMVEGDKQQLTNGELTISISPTPYRNVILTYGMEADTASPTEYQVPQNTTINVPAGTTSLPLGVTIIGDWVDEANDLERFFVTLSSPNTEAISVTQNTKASVYIQDDDFADFTIEPQSLIIKEGETKSFSLTLDTELETGVSFVITQSLDSDERMMVAPTSFLFDEHNYNQALDIDITGLDDSVANYPETFNVIVNPSTSADIPYKNLPSKELPVQVRDADVNFLFAGFMLNDYRIPFDYQETFDSASVLQYWQLLNGEHEWQNEAYVLKQLTPGYNTRSVAPVSNITVDYSVEVDVFVPESADPYTYVGLLFDFKSNVEFYRFIIRPTVSEYKLEKYTQDTGYITMAYGNSAAINGGHSSNRLRIERRGAQIFLFANDLPLNSLPIIDTTYQYGRVGLIIVAPNTFVNTPLAAGQFDNFAVLELHD
ncbi:MAG: Calx-beta domain-containing protein [Anaerolineales bacterium]